MFEIKSGSNLSNILSLFIPSQYIVFVHTFSSTFLCSGVLARGTFTQPSSLSGIKLSPLIHLLVLMTGTTVDSKADEEEAELQTFERHKKFFQAAKSQGIDAWCEENREKAPVDIQRDINLFIARYSADLEVVITCDGCTENIKGRRYRCLNCVDMDLCSACYNSTVKPNEHNNQHEVIDLRYLIYFYKSKRETPHP